jgi:hypothetical protein
VIKLWKPFALAIVAGGTAVAVATAASASAAPTKPAPRMSAVTLVDGLLLNQGPAAAYLTALRRPTVTVDGKLAQVRQIVDSALTAHPGQADVFARQVQSGDRVQVLAALRWLGGLDHAAMNRVYGASATEQAIAKANTMIKKAASPTTPNGGSADPQAVPVYACVDVVVVLQLVLAVAQIAVAVVVIGIFFEEIQAQNQPGSPGQLATEEFVNLVAGQLRAA